VNRLLGFIVSGSMNMYRWWPLAPAQELNIETTLFTGQCFRWTHHEDAVIGVVSSTVFGLKQVEGETLFAVIHTDGVEDNAVKSEVKEKKRKVKTEVKNETVAEVPPKGTVTVKVEVKTEDEIKSEAKAAVSDMPEKARALLRKYLQLDVVSREALDVTWCHEHPEYARVLVGCMGVRCVQVPILEGLVGMMGSANNNIARNTKMVAAVCAAFPTNALVSLGGVTQYRFPSLGQLAGLDEAAWHTLGWGYRAGRMVTACHQMLDRGGECWLEGLAHAGYSEVHAAILELSGVGPKVADCVCLFSLGMHAVVPLDGRTAKKHLRKEMTSSNYPALQAMLQAQFGPHAGWAFITLFAAQLHGLHAPSHSRDQHSLPIAAEVKSEVKSEVKREVKREV